MIKPSAIKRELDIVIVLNNDTDDKIEEDEEEERIKKKARIEEKILKETLHAKCDRRIIIKDRKNQTDDNDIYKQILDYMKQKHFCYMKQEHFFAPKRKYIDYEDGDYSCCIYYSDFIIFINDGLIDRDNISYKPMCIAFIKIYEDPDNKYKFSYISLICSDRKMGQCGSFLMNIIKYVSTLLNCNEIRVDSVPEEDVYKFYNRNGFIEKNVEKVEYNHYYPIQPEDAVFKPADTIQGEASINPLLENPEEGAEEEKREAHGGKSTFKSTFKKSTFKKSGAKRKTKKSTFKKSTFKKSTFKKSGAKRKTKKS